MIQLRLSLIFPLIIVRFDWGLKQITKKKYKNLVMITFFLQLLFCLIR